PAHLRRDQVDVIDTRCHVRDNFEAMEILELGAADPAREQRDDGRIVTGGNLRIGREPLNFVSRHGVGRKEFPHLGGDENFVWHGGETSYNSPPSGEVSEWLKEPVSKTGRPVRVSRVRIPPSPFLSARSARASAVQSCCASYPPRSSLAGTG